MDEALILRYRGYHECLETVEDSKVGVFKCHIYLCGLPVWWIIGTLNSMLAAAAVCECLCPHICVHVGVGVGVSLSVNLYGFHSLLL